MDILKKITIKDVCGRTRIIAPEGHKDGDPIPDRLLMLVMGMVTRVSDGNAQYGDFIKLHGQFEATNLSNNKQFAAGACILPDVANDMVHAQFAAEGVTTVQFAFRIGVKVNDSVAIGYEYYAEPVVSMAENDPLAALRKAITDQSKETGTNSAKKK